MESKEIIVKYLEDAEAAERNFEDVLAGFSKAGEQLKVQIAFAEMSRKAKTQHERLRARLEALGGGPSTAKSLLAHVFGFAPTLAQLGHQGVEINTQHLMMCYASAAGEIAMYESLAATAAAAGDTETEQLARQLQQEEREDQAQVWQLLGASTRNAYNVMTGQATGPLS